mgnify:FL=1
MKYIVVTGGVISGLGKGITASSIGLLLKNLGLKVTAIKIDPYFNVDAGMMSPFEHGEVYVLEDGTETDLDLGNYERFLGIKLQKDHSITSGKMFWEVINAERQGKYLGKTVQIMPHVTDHIKNTIKNVALLDVGEGTPDICIIEVGGTVGDMESAHFTESIRQLMFEDGESWCSVHVSLLVDIGAECKTKPTQNTVRDLRKLGISPDFLVCRSKVQPSIEELRKLSLMCQVGKEHIITAFDVNSIYSVPKLFFDQGFHSKIVSKLRVKSVEKSKLMDFSCIFNVNYFNKPVNIGILGKYTKQVDSYLSLIRALEHACFSIGVDLKINWIESSGEKHIIINKIKETCNGIIIPGGFGVRGTHQMIEIAKLTLEENIPTFGICLGFQVMALVLAQVANPNFTSEEFVEDKKGQFLLFKKGDMKLGSHKIDSTDFVGNHNIFHKKTARKERYRHRYHLIKNVDRLLYNEEASMLLSPHKFWCGVQFHPEFNSAWGSPSPYFKEFIKVVAENI